MPQDRTYEIVTCIEQQDNPERNARSCHDLSYKQTKQAGDLKPAL